MKFYYFEGPVDEMGDLIEGSHVCSFCGKKNNMCFDINFAITNRYSDAEKEGKIGCVECLKKGEFEFWHDTNMGCWMRKD